MKNMKKKLVAGIVLCAVFITGAFAGGSVISATLRPDITVNVDGSTKTFYDASGTRVYPISYNNTTYLPIRAIGGLMGKTVEWDETTQTITLGSASTNTNNNTQSNIDTQNATGVITHNESVLDNGKMLVELTNAGAQSISEFDMQVTFYDAAGNALSVEDDGHDAILPGATVASIIDLPRDDNYALVKYDSYKVAGKIDNETRLYENLSKQIVIKANKGAQGVVTGVTNNSAKAIDELELVVVYYKNGKAIGAAQKDTYDLASGDTISIEFTAPYNTKYESLEYDDFKIIVNQAHNFGF